MAFNSSSLSVHLSSNIPSLYSSSLSLSASTKSKSSWMFNSKNDCSYPYLITNCSSSSENGSFHDLSNLRQQTTTLMPFGLINGEELRPNVPYKWQRGLLKVSGEELAGDNKQNIDPKVTMSIAREVASITQLSVEVAIMVGRGNNFRGASWVGSSGLERSSADYIGILATVMNAIFIKRRAVRHQEKGWVVIFAAGTGNPFFSTDTAAALRSVESNAEVVLKATNVDSVYDQDPKENPNARLLDDLCYQDVMTGDLLVMDMTAITLIMLSKL